MLNRTVERTEHVFVIHLLTKQAKSKLLQTGRRQRRRRKGEEKGQALWAGVFGDTPSVLLVASPVRRRDGDTPSVFLVASPVRRREWQLWGPADASGVCLILGHGCPFLYVEGPLEMLLSGY